MLDNGSFLVIRKLRHMPGWPETADARAGHGSGEPSEAAQASLSPEGLAAVLARRNMHYGPAAGESGAGSAADAGERGLVAMAYGAQLGRLLAPVDVPAALLPEWRLCLFVPAMKGLERLAES